MAKKLTNNTEIRNAIVALAVALLSSEDEKSAFPIWLQNQRRGFGKFAKNGKIAMSAEDIVALFHKYTEKCNKQGIDITTIKVTGRPCLSAEEKAIRAAARAEKKITVEVKGEGKVEGTLPADAAVEMVAEIVNEVTDGDTNAVAEAVAAVVE